MAESTAKGEYRFDSIEISAFSVDRTQTSSRGANFAKRNIERDILGGISQ
jgi:hypothetical protein